MENLRLKSLGLAVFMTLLFSGLALAEGLGEKTEFESCGVKADQREPPSDTPPPAIELPKEIIPAKADDAN